MKTKVSDHKWSSMVVFIVIRVKSKKKEKKPTFVLPVCPKVLEIAVGLPAAPNKV